MRNPLLALAVAAFAIGTSEFIIMGLLPELAQSFHVSIPRAGLLVSAYALSVTVGSPVMALAVGRLNRKTALLGLLTLFVLGNTLCAVAPTYGLLMAARVLTALCHGAFFGIGSIVAASVVPREKRAQAITIMFSGLTLANVMGVPAGTALGQAFGWRAAFVAIVPVGLIAGAAVWMMVPRQEPEVVRLRHELKAVLRPGVQLVLALSTLSSVALFCVFTYIAPMLEVVTRLSEHTVTWVLVVFGVGITIGTLAGGRLSDWKQMPTILGGFLLLIVLLLVMPLVMRMPWAMMAMVLVWGGEFWDGRTDAGADRRPGEGRAKSGVDAEPGGVQPGERDRGEPGRAGADGGLRVYAPAAGGGGRGGGGAGGCGDGALGGGPGGAVTAAARHVPALVGQAARGYPGAYREVLKY